MIHGIFYRKRGSFDVNINNTHLSPQTCSLVMVLTTLNDHPSPNHISLYLTVEVMI